MVRFSCFQAHVLSLKRKKTIPQSSEAMHKALEDSPQKQGLSNLSDLNTENKPCLKEEVEPTVNYTADHSTDCSPTDHDYRSEGMDGKDSSECDSMVHENAQIRTCQSVGCGLNWDERTSVADGSEEEMEQGFSFDGSHDHSRTVAQDSVDNNELGLSDQLRDPVPSDSVQVDSDVAKNTSIFSIGDPEQTLEGGADKDEHNSADVSPHTGHVIVKSRSLPMLGSPQQDLGSHLAHPISADNLSTLNSWKKGMDGVERHVQCQEQHNSMYNDDENTGENHADENDDYNYSCSAKDWILPISDGPNPQEDMKGDTSYDQWNELTAKDFLTKRIEDWVINIQHSSQMDESNEPASCYVEEPHEDNALLEEPTVSKVEGKVNPGMEAAKRYISSLNASATAAQLSNLGLQVIPFLSPFGSLKTLNLSGNAIVRIASGALPRGLHVLNLSKNSISTIEGLRDLTRLRVLDLSYNRILRIGHGLGACSSIKELYLAGNKISEVEGLHRLLKLNVLDLRFNKISTAKCLGQLAANYNSLQALSLEGNPAQKNVGDEQLKKYLLSLIPNLTFYNRQSIKVGGTTKDAAERSARMSSHQIDRGHRVEAKAIRKASHSVGVQKAGSSSNHGRKGPAFASPKSTRSRHARLPPSGMKTTATPGHQFDFITKGQSLRKDLLFSRSRSEGNLGAL